MFASKDFDRAQFQKSGALFAKSDQVWLFWGEPVASDSRPEAIAIQNPPFFAKSTSPWLLYPYVVQISRMEAQSLFPSRPTSVKWENFDPAPFVRQFEEIQKTFAQGELQKVVPYTFEWGDVNEDFFLENFIGHALQIDKGFLYGQWKGDQGEIGLSPELLVSQMNEKNFATMALAGTCTVEQWEKNPELFQKDPKEQHEHEKVIEDIVQQLKGYGGVDVHETSVVSTPDLVHLLTPIVLKASSNLKLEKLIERLHPTAALGGFPRSSSQSLLRKFEEWQPRDRFGAPFAVSFSPRSADVIVSIRQLTWDGQRIKVGAGCGVVPQSTSEKELQELATKRNSVKKIFGVL